MTKRFIAAALLITTAGLLSGCGTTGNKDLGDNNVQEITLVNAQQNNEQTELKTQEIVRDETQNQNSVENETQNQDNENDTHRKDKKQNDSKSQVSISLEQAKSLALDRVSGATENDVWIELDYDDGHYVYEGEILYGQKEYEFEIDANTGTFLEWSEERR